MDTHRAIKAKLISDAASLARRDYIKAIEAEICGQKTISTKRVILMLEDLDETLKAHAYNLSKMIKVLPRD